MKVVLTEDGSKTLYHEQMLQHYHSIHGALAESQLIFIEYGLKEVLKDYDSVNILEIGMGTGLNVLLSVIEVVDVSANANYIAVEPFPLDKDIVAQLNYADVLNVPNSEGYFRLIHDCIPGIPYYICDNFILNKLYSKIQDIELANHKFHVIYFDAFDTVSQGEMWTVEVFSKLFRCLVPGGILVTYSCKSEVQRVLKSCGFIVEKLKGPVGKREVLRAKSSNKE